VNQSLTFTYKEEVSLEIFSDADWAGDITDAKSTTGFVIKLAGAPVSYGSLKQSTVSLSSTEAEYIAASETAREAVFIRNLLQSLEVTIPSPLVIQVDNTTAIQMTEESRHLSRRKHINVKYHYIRELVMNKEFSLTHIPTQQQQADILTKPLNIKQFEYLRNLIDGNSLTH
jgi:hypothetical protein